MTEGFGGLGDLLGGILGNAAEAQQLRMRATAVQITVAEAELDKLKAELGVVMAEIDIDKAKLADMPPGTDEYSLLAALCCAKENKGKALARLITAHGEQLDLLRTSAFSDAGDLPVQEMTDALRAVGIPMPEAKPQPPISGKVPDDVSELVDGDDDAKS